MCAGHTAVTGADRPAVIHREGRVGQVDAERLESPGAVQHHTGYPGIVTNRAFVPPAIAEGATAELLYHSARAKGEALGQCPVLNGESTVERTGHLGQYPVGDMTTADVLVQHRHVQPEAALDGGVVGGGEHPGIPDQVIRNGQVLEEVPFLHIALVAAAQPGRVAGLLVGEKAEEGGELFGVAPFAGDRVEIAAGHRTVFDIGVIAKGLARERRFRGPGIGVGAPALKLGLIAGAFFRIAQPGGHSGPTCLVVVNIGVGQFAERGQSHLSRRRAIAVRHKSQRGVLVPTRHHTLGQGQPHSHGSFPLGGQGQGGRLEPGRHPFPTFKHLAGFDRHRSRTGVIQDHRVRHRTARRGMVATHCTFSHKSRCAQHTGGLKLTAHDCDRCDELPRSLVGGLDGEITPGQPKYVATGRGQPDGAAQRGAVRGFDGDSHGARGLERDGQGQAPVVYGIKGGIAAAHKPHVVKATGLGQCRICQPHATR